MTLEKLQSLGRNATGEKEESRAREIGRETFETLRLDRERDPGRDFSLSLPLLPLLPRRSRRRWNRGRRPVAKGSLKSKQRYVIRAPGVPRFAAWWPAERRSLFPSYLSLAMPMIAESYSGRIYGVIPFIRIPMQWRAIARCLARERSDLFLWGSWISRGQSR